LRELLEALLGPEGRRRLQLRHLTNDDLFRLYDDDLVLRLRNAKNLSDTRKILARFREYLNGYPPSPELAKGFLSQYADRAPRTLYRYAMMLKVFFKWYGEPLELTIKVPKSLPSYTEDSDIEKLFYAIEHKQTHKGTIVRDSLMVALALKSGMRRGELANLQAKDVHPDFVVVRNGKNNKDRTIPLSPAIAGRLSNFVATMKPEEKVFKLKGPCITMKVKAFARKAGLSDFHCHSARHKYATTLLERGVNIRQVQQLLGHESLSTTQVYLSVVDSQLAEAIKVLDDHDKPEGKPGLGMPYDPQSHKFSWELPQYQSIADRAKKGK
jgi:integrase/recombinase XerD